MVTCWLCLKKYGCICKTTGDTQAFYSWIGKIWCMNCCAKSRNCYLGVTDVVIGLTTFKFSEIVSRLRTLVWHPMWSLIARSWAYGLLEAGWVFSYSHGACLSPVQLHSGWPDSIDGGEEAIWLQHWGAWSRRTQLRILLSHLLTALLFRNWEMYLSGLIRRAIGMRVKYSHRGRIQINEPPSSPVRWRGRFSV